MRKDDFISLGWLKTETVVVNGKSVIIAELHAEYPWELMEECKKMKDSGCPPVAADNYWVTELCLASIVDSDLSRIFPEKQDREEARASKKFGKTFYDALWPKVDELNKLTGPASGKRKKSKTSTEEELPSSGSDDSQENSDSQA